MISDRVDDDIVKLDDIFVPQLVCIFDSRRSVHNEEAENSTCEIM